MNVYAGLNKKDGGMTVRMSTGLNNKDLFE